MQGVGVQLSGGLGNQLWQLSAGMMAGGGAISVAYQLSTPAARCIASRLLHPLPAWAPDSGRLLPFGYYQHLRHAAPAADMLRLVLPCAAEALPCVVHLRGGDFRHHPAYAATIPAAEVLRSRVAVLGISRDADVTVVTDDPELAAQLCPQWHCQSSSTLHDFHTMRRARTLVMSSSTMSWWAAYCGEARRIVFPRLWPVDNGAGADDGTSAQSGAELLFDHTRCILHD